MIAPLLSTCRQLASPEDCCTPDQDREGHLECIPCTACRVRAGRTHRKVGQHTRDCELDPVRIDAGPGFSLDLGFLNLQDMPRIEQCRCDFTFEFGQVAMLFYSFWSGRSTGFAESWMVCQQSHSHSAKTDCKLQMSNEQHKRKVNATLCLISILILFSVCVYYHVWVGNEQTPAVIVGTLAVTRLCNSV